MPKVVDPEERREQIAGALLRVLSRDGLEGASLRHVAAEAGVTAGMVQHYFSTKDAMLEFAMVSASARYEQRITAALEQLGTDPDPALVIATLLRGLLPADGTEADDARVSLAFLTYAAGHPAAAERLAGDNQLLRDHLAGLITAVRPELPDAAAAAAALLGTAEGLAVHVLCARLPVAEARHALEQHLALVLGR